MIESTRSVGLTLVTGERPASHLALARAALVTAEQAETTERAKLADVLERERRTLYALEQTAAAIRTAKDRQGIEAARTRAGDLEQEREFLLRARRGQEEALKAARSRRLGAQIAVEAVRQHAGRLERAVLQAEQGVVARQRSIVEAEADLARRADELARQRAALADAQAALNGLRRDFAEVGDPSTDGARP
jgi:chromosome segregation ATPase